MLEAQNTIVNKRLDNRLQTELLFRITFYRLADPERAHKTLQDRLVKELRLAGAATLAEVDALLPRFMADYNARFAKPPANAKDLHRPLAEVDDLDEILAWREERTVTSNLTLCYDQLMLLLDPTQFARGLAGKKSRW